MEVFLSFIIIVVTTIILGLIVNAIGRARSEAMRNAEPGCGRCGYPVRGLRTFNCPECGGDFRKVGIRSPYLKPDRGYIAPIVLWSIACLILGAITSNIADNYSHITIRHEQQRYAFVDDLLRDAGIEQLSIDVEIKEVGDRKARPSIPNASTINLLPVEGPVQKMVVQLDTLAYTSQRKVESGKFKGSELDARAFADWVNSASTGNHGQVPEEIARTFIQNLRAIGGGMEPRWPFTVVSSGGSSNVNSRRRIGPDVVPLLWVGLWIVGVVLIFRRHRRRVAGTV